MSRDDVPRRSSNVARFRGPGVSRDVPERERAIVEREA